MLPIQRLKKSNTIDNLWIYVLTLIKEAPKNEPIYAWQIRSAVKKKFGFLPGEITAYRVLYRLEKDGFVKSQQAEIKRFYKITDKGVKELDNAVKFYKETLDLIKG